MRGCALPLTKLAPPPHLCSAINSFPFPIAPTHSLTIFHTPKPKLFTLLSTTQRVNANAEFSSSSASTSVTSQQKQQEDDNNEEETFQVLTAMKSDYNDIMIVDTPKSRVLLLDSTRTPLSLSISLSL